MLQGIIKVLLFYGGQGLVALGYGKEGMAAREKLGIAPSNGLAWLWGGLAFIWIFCGFFFFFAVDSTGGLVTMIVCPVIYGTWFLYARKSSAKLIEESKKVEAVQKPD